MRFKHYSLRTERTYRGWSRRCLLFHGKRHPPEMGAAEVSSFLSDLAVRHRVASFTQNKALDALVFLCRLLHRDLEQVSDIARAKRPERLPVVLTRTEVDQVVAGMTGMCQLMAKLLYGSGMRLMVFNYDW